jgi:hypothetical protein
MLAESKSPSSPCHPNICGPHTTCENVKGHAICRCLPGLLGDPADVAGCHPECVLSSDCAADKTCVDYRCKNLCQEDICGVKAECRAVNNSPLCSCPQPLVGNPFEECYLKEGSTFRQFACLRELLKKYFITQTHYLCNILYVAMVRQFYAYS